MSSLYHILSHTLKVKEYMESCHENSILNFEPCDVNSIDVEEQETFLKKGILGPINGGQY